MNEIAYEMWLYKSELNEHAGHFSGCLMELDSSLAVITSDNEAPEYDDENGTASGEDRTRHNVEDGTTGNGVGNCNVFNVKNSTGNSVGNHTGFNVENNTANSVRDHAGFNVENSTGYDDGDFTGYDDGDSTGYDVGDLTGYDEENFDVGDGSSFPE